MKILALDPGESTGFVVFDIAEKTLEVVNYGEIPVVAPGLDGLLMSVWRFLHQTEVDELVFEEFISSQRFPTTREAGEVRAVIRLFCLTSQKPFASYVPATVRSVLKVGDKRGVRNLVQETLGFKVRGKDHVTDAVGVGFCHAMKRGLWYPARAAQGDFSTDRNLGGKQARKPKSVQDVESMTPAELSAALQAGTVRVGAK